MIKGERSLLVKVYRFDPSADREGRFQEYEVPAKEYWTVMDVLDYISRQLDGTVAYFRHSACDHGICGRCVLKVNGEPHLACTYSLNQEQELILEPKNENIVRDLVTN